MELRHLRYFVAVATEMHYGRAAQKLNIAQPAVSRAIQDLERELGVKLFERLPRGVQITEAGARYLADVQRILGDLSTASRKLKAGQHEPKVLRIGYSMLLESMAGKLDSILGGFARAFPHYVVDLQFLSTFEQQQAILEGRIDAGLARVCGAPPKGLRKLRVQDDPFCGARLGAANLVARFERLRVADLHDEPLLIYRRSRNPATFDYTVNHLRKAGYTGDIIQNADFSFLNWKTMPRERGWILLNRSATEIALPGTVCRPFEDLEIPYGIDFIWRRDDSSEAIESLVSSMRQIAKTKPLQDAPDRRAGTGSASAKLS